MDARQSSGVALHRISPLCKWADGQVSALMPSLSSGKSASGCFSDIASCLLARNTAFICIRLACSQPHPAVTLSRHRQKSNLASQVAAAHSRKYIPLKCFEHCQQTLVRDLTCAFAYGGRDFVTHAARDRGAAELCD